MTKWGAFLTIILYTAGAVVMGTLLYTMLSGIDVEPETIKGEIVDMWQDDTDYWAVVMNNNGHYFSIKVTTETYYENNVGDHVKLKVKEYANGDYYEVDA